MNETQKTCTCGRPICDQSRAQLRTECLNCYYQYEQEQAERQRRVAEAKVWAREGWPHK